tara:strand:- start:4 stop:216 length:213 start_codon:yes stop_codon:yes gene_type:complete
MNKLLNRLKSKKFWSDCLDTAKLLAILDYLTNLSEDGNYIGFWVVVFIFGFQPVYGLIKELIKTKPWRKK